MGERRRESKADSRIQQVDPQRANGKAKRLVERVQEKLGFVPNVFRVLANAPAALEGYLSFLEALADGAFEDRTRLQIALTVAETNLCAYSVSTHTLLAKKAGLTPEEIADATRACATDPRTDALLKLARAIVVQRGEVSDTELDRARGAGLTDSEVVETVANVALNTFTIYVAHVARPALDFQASRVARPPNGVEVRRG